VKIFLSFILFFNSFVSAVAETTADTQNVNQATQKKQLVLQILNNQDGTRLKAALKTVLPTEDHAFIDTHIPDKIQINYKINNDVITINSKTQIKLTADSAIMLNGVRVTYNTSQSFESNLKTISEKSRQFGLINLLLPQKAHAILPGLIAGKIAIDVLVPAVILGLTSALTVLYGPLVWKFFNYSMIDNAEIICNSQGQLYYNKPNMDLGVDLPEVVLVEKSLAEYKKQLSPEKKCTDSYAKEVQKQVRILASAAATKAQNEQSKKDASAAPNKDISAPKQKSSTTH